MGASRKTREEILDQEHSNWVKEVEMSEIPSHLEDVYGTPHINIPPDEEETEH